MKSGSDFSLYISSISKFGLFDDKYSKDNETDVLIKILKQQPDVEVISENDDSITLRVQEKDDEGNDKGQPKIITIPKKGSSDSDSDDNGNSIESNNASDKLVDGLANSIQNHLDQQKLKGDGSFLLDQDLGSSIKTNIDWFDKLKSNFYTIVNRKTKQSLVNWSKLNSKFAHNHKSPTHKNIENTLNVILCVDNSGSMSNDSLKKLLYIIEQKRSKISDITILKHTDSITGVLSNEKSDKKILEFLSKRDSGGTSHSDVFKYLDNNISKADLSKSIFISFSDNYSDIESQYPKFKNIRKITKVWLNADGKPVESFIPGLKIDIF
jgi:predicted metal-dependent peptidase